MDGESHHLLWLWDGNATEELVVAEDLLVSRDQISCREKGALHKMSKLILFNLITFIEAGTICPRNPYLFFFSLC